MGADPHQHRKALPARANSPRCRGHARTVRGSARHARLEQRARPRARRDPSHDRSRRGELENRRTRSVRSRDRGRPAAGRSGGPDDLRQARLDALDWAGAGSHAQPELGWALSRAYWGRGYATEAAAAIRDWAFERPNFDRLVSLISPENVRS